jgi:hypothetical protein
MRFHLWIWLAAVGLLLLSCASHPARGHESTEATVEQLLSAPDRFDGARVVVTGFLLQPMVGDVTIHQTEPDYHHYQRETGIGLDLDPNQRNLAPFQLKRCVLRGTFHAKRAQGKPSRIGEITSLELAQ